MERNYVAEGDKCPECGEGTIAIYEQSRLKCDNCGATYNDRGERVPCDNATSGTYRREEIMRNSMEIKNQLSKVAKEILESDYRSRGFIEADTEYKT